jgi:hypothetical protein
MSKQDLWSVVVLFFKLAILVGLWSGADAAFIYQNF